MTLKIPDHDFSYLLNGVTHKLQVAKDLDIQADQINECFQTQAGFRSYYATKHREAELIADQLEDDFDIWLAKTKNELRTYGKSTEKALEEAAMATPEYAKWREELNNTRYIERMLKDFVLAFDARGFMLPKLGQRMHEDSTREYNEPTVNSSRRSSGIFVEEDDV
jgi:hypothetical protein